ncbi:DUF2867 domain-containing protein [Pseudomonas capeferrum]|uniref:DUF2867 domain-containing protein n=1 Tax=Pseudomonas capeferrum TaxID=1495066 RepID=UPI0015E48AC7|nr:DUF2867 domain-containing protein [Pseudomonas capeferrum]MBA1202857.1 DUF2867 domain-containing protein [Pseudomonas capeferrum]
MSAALSLAPKDVRLIDEPARLDFLHCDAVQVRGPISVLQAYCAMTSQLPAWLSGAFRIRDLVSRRFKVLPIHGFSPRTPDRVPIPGERLDFFTVEAISAQRLLLTSRDTHLAVMVCMDLASELDPAAAGALMSLSVTTSVTCFNTFGRLYMLPVAPTHGTIVARMLRNVTAAFSVVAS